MIAEIYYLGRAALDYGIRVAKGGGPKAAANYMLKRAATRNTEFLVLSAAEVLGKAAGRRIKRKEGKKK